MNLPSDCILWTGAFFKGSGYGCRTVGGKVVSTHRHAWTEANGPIPDGLFVLHRCDVKLCYNVEHLFLGTHADNMADKVAKGRQSRGEGHGRAALTETAVLEMRAGTLTPVEAASRYGCTPAAARMARRGQTWRHL